LLTNDSIAERLIILDILENNHWFFDQQVLIFDNIVPNRPLSQFSIHMTKDYVNKLTTGISNKPNFSLTFPATLITTNLDWEDIVLSDQVKDGLNEIELWIRFEKKILEEYGLGKKIKRGFKTVFYGPSGTGKTLAASLLGKKYGLDVYRIDLSQLVSKYIGETEKNLSNLFNQAANKNWILFFDEAESLFSKRTNNSSSNDKYANQQVGFLLQKIEEYPGVIILATNLKGNIDEAFLRRFQSMIYFEIPEVDQRYLLWKSAFGDKFILEECIDLKSIAKEYQLVGGQIINIVKSAILRELGNNSEIITEKILIESIKKELKKN
jgi:SpoVK/Ycf46/Vps4 family AAA+-type ATPase